MRGNAIGHQSGARQLDHRADVILNCHSVLTNNLTSNFLNQLPLLPEFLAQAKLLAVTEERRSPAFPDTPTVAEAGFPRMQRYFWLGVVAPGGTASTWISRRSLPYSSR